MEFPDEELDKLIQSDWQNRIIEATESWTVNEAESFLASLEEAEIATGDILRLLQAPSYLQAIQAGQNGFHFLSQEGTKAAQGAAANVFFDFASAYSRDVEGRMGSEWVDDLILATESWTDTEAHHFLNSLGQAHISTEDTLSLLQATDYLRKLKENGFHFTFTVQETVQSVMDIASPPAEENAVTGSDVFIDYARRHLREQFEKEIEEGTISLEGQDIQEAFETYFKSYLPDKGSKTWEERISHHARNWNTVNARLFLNFLERQMQIEPLTIVRMLNTVSFFKTNYNSFMERIRVYGKYLTNAEIKKMLERTPSAFQRGRAKNLEKFLLFSEDYFGNENTRKILKSNPQAVALASGRFERFKQNLEYLEIYLGKGDRALGKTKINEMLLQKGGQSRGFQGIVEFKVSKNENGDLENERVKWLENRGLEQDDIIKLIEANPRAFSTGDLSDEKIVYLETYLGKGNRVVGKAKLNGIIKRGGLLGIVNFKVYKNEDGDLENERVKWLENRGLEQDDIIKLIESNPQAFSMGDLSDGKIAYLETYLGKGNRAVGEAKLNGIIKREGFQSIVDKDKEHNESSMIKRGGFQGIVDFKVYKNEDGELENERVKWLEERGLEQDDIIKLIELNPRAFSRGDLSDEKIAYLETYLGKGDRAVGKVKLNEIIKRGGFLGIVNFKAYKNENGDLENEMIKLLEAKDGMRLTQDQVIEIIENHPLDIFSGELTQEKAIAFIEQLVCSGALTSYADKAK